MKCPLLSKVYIEEPESINKTVADCLKEECAWWDESQGRCAVKEIALCLKYISIDTTQLLEKIPHAGQFPK